MSLGHIRCGFLFRQFRVYAIGRKAKTEIPASPS